MTLRVIAIAPPQFQTSETDSLALSSADPASLFNACRLAARASDQEGNAWSESNWSGGRKSRRECVFLFDGWDTAQHRLELEVKRLAPNLVLIGAMSICLRGAIECATLIKAMLGDRVCIVLGGRHVTETMWLDPISKVVRHHVSSPASLISRGFIEPVFDIVLAGEGEEIIPAIGLLVEETVLAHRPAATAAKSIGSLKDVGGTWIAASVSGTSIDCLVSGGRTLDYSSLVTPAKVFGVRARFEVFGGRPTAHVFSDIGPGCIYDCGFCSERISVVGPPRMFETSATRLASYLKDVDQVVQEDYSSPASAFCEDSTLLGFSPKLIDEFCRLVGEESLDVRLGGQLTIDQVLRSPALLKKLNKAGLMYLFIGLETPEPQAIGGMSKDIGHRKGSWLDRAYRAVEAMLCADIQPGISLLFGLGEGTSGREMLYHYLEQIRTTFGHPNTVSMNWATQHPLRGDDGGANYTYLEWAIPEPEDLRVLRHFGEASTTYPLSGQFSPSASEAAAVIAEIGRIATLGPVTKGEME